MILFSQKLKGRLELTYDSSWVQFFYDLALSCIFLGKYQYSGEKKEADCIFSELRTTSLSWSPKRHIPVCKAGILRDYCTLVSGVGLWLDCYMTFNAWMLLVPGLFQRDISVLALPPMTDSSEWNLWAVGALPNTSSYQGAPFYHHPSLSNDSGALLPSWQYCVTTWVPKTIQSQDRMSTGNPPHKKAIVHNMPEGSGRLRRFAFVWGRRQFSHLQTYRCLRFFFLSVLPEFFSPLFSAAYPFSLVNSELLWLAGMHITFLKTQSIVISTSFFPQCLTVHLSSR